MFFFNETSTTEIYTLSLHDALPISIGSCSTTRRPKPSMPVTLRGLFVRMRIDERPRSRSEEHTSELQSRENLVCRLLLEKKKKKQSPHPSTMRCSSQASVTCCKSRD